MFFEDLHIGLRNDYGSYTFTADNIMAFARKFDPQPFHMNEEAGRASIYGGLIASGWHVGAACMGLLVAANRRRIEAAIARGEKPAIGGPSPGFKELKWLKPVFAGDTVTYGNVIEALRPSTSRPEWGLLTARTTGVNQHGEPVYSFLATGFAPRKPTG